MNDLGLIKSRTNAFINPTHQDWDDMFGDACLGYVKATKGYNPNSGATFSTYAYRTITNHLISTQTNNKKHLHYELPEGIPAPSNTYILPILSHNAKIIRNLILLSPDTYSSIPPKKARGIIRRELLNMGWGHTKIWETFKELKMAYK